MIRVSRTMKTVKAAFSKSVSWISIVLCRGRLVEEEDIPHANPSVSQSVSPSRRWAPYYSLLSIYTSRPPHTQNHIGPTHRNSVRQPMRGSVGDCAGGGGFHRTDCQLVLCGLIGIVRL